MLSSVAYRYAEALYELAEEAGKLAAVREQLDALQEALRETPEAVAALRHPGIGLTDKLELVAAVLHGAAEPLVMQFVKLAVERGSPEAFVQAGDAMQAVADERAGVVVARVQAAAPLSEQQLTRLSGALSRLSEAPVRLEIAIAPELLGGARVQLGDRVIDGSLSHRLEQIVGFAAGHSPGGARPDGIVGE